MASPINSPIAEHAAAAFNKTVDMMQLAKDIGAFKGAAGAMSTDKNVEVALQSVGDASKGPSTGIA